MEPDAKTLALIEDYQDSVGDTLEVKMNVEKQIELAMAEDQDYVHEELRMLRQQRFWEARVLNWIEDASSRRSIRGASVTIVNNTSSPLFRTYHSLDNGRWMKLLPEIVLPGGQESSSPLSFPS